MTAGAESADTSRQADHRVLKVNEAATFLSLSKRKLQILHAQGAGPSRTRLSESRVGYQVADLVTWLTARREKTPARAGA